jgi:UDP-2-acetamido-2,6-beta-L-arabino-hexul-4-ose reductase
VVTNESYEVLTHGDAPRVVETVPGWTHDITNVGDDEMVVMLWANEIFDRQKPDTITLAVKQ